MKLTANERKGLIDQLNVNCACGTDKEVLNNLSDGALLAFANNAKKKGKDDEDDDEDDSEMEDNASGGKPDSSNADATGGGSVKSGGYDRMTDQENKVGKGLTKNARKPLTERLTPEEQEVWNSAVAVHEREKRQIALQLTANVSDKAKREILFNRLMKKPLAELQEQLSYFPRQTQRQSAPALMPSFLGNAGGPDTETPPTVNHQDPDLLLDEPVLNYAEIVAEQRRDGRQPANQAS